MKTDLRIVTLVLSGMLWLAGCQPTMETRPVPAVNAPPPPPSNSQQMIDEEFARKNFEAEAAKSNLALRQARDLGVGSDELDVTPILMQAASAAEAGDYATATRLVQDVQLRAEEAAQQALARKAQRK